MAVKALFTIGEIVGVHGLGGNLKVRSYAESIETYKPGINVQLKSSENNDGTWFEILKASSYKKGILLSLKGVKDINLAESLRGREILIKREDLPEPEDNAYYWQDLVGLEVLDKKQGYLGKVESIIETGANDVFVVKQDKNGNKEEVLVPAIASVIKAVDIDKGTMEIELPEGL